MGFSVSLTLASEGTGYRRVVFGAAFAVGCRFWLRASQRKQMTRGIFSRRGLPYTVLQQIET